MNKRFTFYAYNSPTSGVFTDDGEVYYYSEDFRTKAKYEEYKKVGFDYLLLQHENSYSGEDFQTSACNLCMTNAVKAGIKKIIVSDTRLKELCAEKNLIGENGRFKTEKDFLSYLDFCTKPYRDRKGFFGIQLKDEPFHDILKPYGMVCKGLKKLLPNAYLQCNVNPIAEKRFYTDDESIDIYVAYEKYLHQFLDETEMDSILFDNYPFRRNYIMYAYYLQTYQIAAKVCKERGVQLRTVMQSFCGLNLGRITYRNVTERDMYWQTNLNIGFGSKEFSYFTYMTKQEITNSKTTGMLTDGVDGGAFVNRDGTKTRLYYFTKRIISEMKKFSKFIYKYEYEDSYLLFEKGKSYLDYDLTELGVTENGSPFPVEFTRGPLLITKLKKANSTVFMVENVGNIVEEYKNYGIMELKLDLLTTSKVKIRSLGNRVKVKSKKGKISTVLPCGEAFFIEIKG